MKWYLETGPEGDIVVSTRIRLARNLAELPFPAHMTQEQTRRVIASTHDALLSADAETVNNFEFFEMERLTPARAMSLAERHLVSPEFARDREGRAL
ncbi:MAG: ATP--guanido phosphotransferase, partial [Clostridia bacterium]|nr:ATP--guanido phosphotransferase [Clostridia bacterium]